MAHQVAKENPPPLQHADHEQVAAGVVVADLLPQLGDASLQILARDKGLADRRLAHRPQSMETQDSNVRCLASMRAKERLAQTMVGIPTRAKRIASRPG